MVKINALTYSAWKRSDSLTARQLSSEHNHGQTLGTDSDAEFPSPPRVSATDMRVSQGRTGSGAGGGAVLQSRSAALLTLHPPPPPHTAHSSYTAHPALAAYIRLPVTTHFISDSAELGCFPGNRLRLTQSLWLPAPVLDYRCSMSSAHGCYNSAHEHVYVFLGRAPG